MTFSRYDQDVELMEELCSYIPYSFQMILVFGITRYDVVSSSLPRSGSGQSIFPLATHQDYEVRSNLNHNVRLEEVRTDTDSL